LAVHVLSDKLAKLIDPRGSDANKDLGPKAKAKDSISHKANVQRQNLKVNDINDHKFYVFHS